LIAIPAPGLNGNLVTIQKSKIKIQKSNLGLKAYFCRLKTVKVND
jgi:hypothetical protein